MRSRESNNPLRSFSLPRVVSMLEAGQAGQFADLHWTYSFIERRDADLLAIIERRISSLQEMDFSVKTAAQKAKARGEPFDEGLAESQRQALVAAYNKFSNIYEAIEHMELAAFRGFSFAQFQADGKSILPEQIPAQAGEVRLECLNSWNIARDGLAGDWYWNPQAQDMRGSNLPAENKLDLRYFLTRTWARPLNEIAIIKFARETLSAKDWDSLIEIYGIPGWIVIMPANIPDGEKTAYRDAAQEVAEGGSGALPNGSDAKCADSPRGASPFKERLQYLTEKLVLAGTGGLLTMLSAPGSGTLAGSAHMEAFRIVARGEARKIGEIFQRQIDKPILDKIFPGKPHLAYFELCANETIDIHAILVDAFTAFQAGYEIDAAQLSEKTGYKLILKPVPVVPAAPPAPALNRDAVSGLGPMPMAVPTPKVEPAAAVPVQVPPAPVAPLTSDHRPLTSDMEAARRTLVSSAVDATLAERRAQLDAWFAALEASLPEKATPAQYLALVEAAVKTMPAQLLTKENVDRLAKIGEGALGSAVVNALAARQGTAGGAA